jgi:hypothetical protein
MDRHLPSWLRETFRIWGQYLAIVLAAIPAAILGALLIARGFSEQTAMIVCVPLALSMAFVGWQLVALWSRKQGQLVVSASPDTSYQLDIAYQQSWGLPVVTAAGFIEGLSRAAMARPSFEHEPAEIEPLAAVQYETIASKTFRLPTTRQQQRRVVIHVRGFKAQQGTGNQPAVRADQLTRAGALSPYFDGAALVGQR